MGEFHVKQRHGKMEKLTGRFFIDNTGNFLGEYFTDGSGITPKGAMPPPANAIEVKERPESHRHVWDKTSKTWIDPGPDEKVIAREAEKEKKKSLVSSAVAKLEAVGLSLDEITALTGARIDRR